MWCTIFKFTINIQTPYVLIIHVLKFEQVHFTTFCCAWNGWTSDKQCRPWSDSVASDMDLRCLLCLSVWILWITTELSVIFIIKSNCQMLFIYFHQQKVAKKTLETLETNKNVNRKSFRCRQIETKTVTPDNAHFSTKNYW